MIVASGLNSHPNLVQVSWDADRYADALGSRPSGHGEAVEQSILNRYPIDPQHDGSFISDPCIIHDRNGKILFWYLPEALTPDKQVGLFVTSNFFIDLIFFFFETEIHLELLIKVEEIISGDNWGARLSLASQSSLLQGSS
jgi:hypothetical protein